MCVQKLDYFKGVDCPLSSLKTICTVGGGGESLGYSNGIWQVEGTVVVRYRQIRRQDTARDQKKTHPDLLPYPSRHVFSVYHNTAHTSIFFINFFPFLSYTYNYTYGGGGEGMSVELRWFL